MTKRNLLVVVTLATLLAAGGCGTNNQLAQVSGQQGQAQQGQPQPQPDPITTGFVDLVFLDSEPPEGVDAVQKIFRDAQGQVVFGPIEHDFSANSTTTEGVPTSATEVEIDYLRNGGFAIFESFHDLEFQDFTGVNARGLGATVVDPTLQAAGSSRSVWSSSVENGQGRFFVATEGQPGRDQGLSPPREFQVKGICYSPASIGTDNRFGPNVGDYFWDSFKIPDGRTILDWDRVWKRDLKDIRPDFNSIRTYSMIAFQTNAKTEGFANSHQFTHKKFLDECWNNGKNPLFVLVGVPLPGTVMLPGGEAADKAFWEENFRRTVTALADHPAVMGFTMFNEIGGADQWGGNAQSSQFYWGQIQTFSEFAKATAPDKLVGFAWFDNPSAVAAANSENLMQQFGGSLDFYGVNAFQSSTVTATLQPYTELGAASKPVLFTEFGLPGTTRTDTSLCSGISPTQSSVDSITTTPESLQTTANALQFILPIALQHPIVGGMMYFEWTDEWWKQDPIPGCYNTDIAKQEGGQNTGEPFPNGYNDEEGFGLHSISLNNRTAANVFDAFNRNAATANNRPDNLTRRVPMYDAVKNAFAPVR